jgi:hypothetical protein
MADYLEKWKTDFPETINNQTRPAEGIDNSLAYNTDGFPQRITNDPVHAKLENDMASQLFSNDERLKELIDIAGTTESNHEKDEAAHANGIAGNAGSATKLATARTIKTNLASNSVASFDGTTNITPGVTGVLPVANGGTGSASEKYVKLIGDTMTGTLTLESVNAKASTAPSTEIQRDLLQFTGSDGNRYGFIRLNHKTDGSHTIAIANVNSSNNPSGDIVFNTDTNGNLTSISGLTPPTSAKNTEIPTAAWVRNFSNALKAIIGVTPEADKLPYFKGKSAAALTTLSSFARTILDDTNASEVRSTIGANAQNCGGIVAQSLTPKNGYVKWANGFSIQWVYAHTYNGKYRTGTFPIAFAQRPLACFACMVGYDYDNNQYNVIYNDQQTTKTTVQIYVGIDDDNVGSPLVLAIGKV